MYLVYIYGSFVFNSFLTFFFFWHLFVGLWDLNLFLDICVGGSRSCTCQERHAEDILTLTCCRAKFRETAWRIFTSWFGTYCIYICFFFKIWCKSQEALCKFSLPCFHYHVLSGCCGISGKYCKYSVFLSIFRYPDKYSWKWIISLLKYCTILKIHFTLQNWQPYFFRGYSYQEYGLFFRFIVS